MDPREIAKQYAEALFTLGEEKGLLPELEQQFAGFYEVFRKEPQLRVFLESPHVTASDKKDLLGKVFHDRVAEDFLHFLYLIADRKRYLILYEIATAFTGTLDKKQGRFRAQVTTAREMDPELMQKVSEALASRSERKIVVEYKVKPELIGGVIFKLEDVQVDGSLRHRLGNYKKLLLEKQEKK